MIDFCRAKNLFIPFDPTTKPNCFQQGYRPRCVTRAFEPREFAKGFFLVFIVFSPLAGVLSVCRGWLW